MKKKFSIITPCLNAEQYISETIKSVINQTAVVSKRVNLEYIICDGGSNDRTVNIINLFISANKEKNISIKLVSENDKSMYDALAKGLKFVTGEICAYINADDFYSLTAFDIVLDVFEQRNIKWITGINTVYNEKSQIVGFYLPFKYRKRLIECGFYGIKLPFIQQESIFWHSSLNNFIDFNQLSEFKYAGDFYLWATFAKKNNLIVVGAYLGGFRINPRQLSSEINSYLKEMILLNRKANIIDYIFLFWDYILWHSSNRMKKFFNKKELLLYNHERKLWI